MSLRVMNLFRMRADFAPPGIASLRFVVDGVLPGSTPEPSAARVSPRGEGSRRARICEGSWNQQGGAVASPSA